MAYDGTALGKSGRYSYDEATGSLELLFTSGGFYFGDWAFDDPVKKAEHNEIPFKPEERRDLAHSAS